MQRYYYLRPAETFEYHGQDKEESGKAILVRDMQLFRLSCLSIADYGLLVRAGCRLATELAVLPLHLVALCRETLVTGGIEASTDKFARALSIARALFSLPPSLAQPPCPPSLNLSIPSRIGVVQLVLWLGQNVR